MPLCPDSETFSICQTAHGVLACLPAATPSRPCVRLHCHAFVPAACQNHSPKLRILQCCWVRAPSGLVHTLAYCAFWGLCQPRCLGASMVSPLSYRTFRRAFWCHSEWQLHCSFCTHPCDLTSLHFVQGLQNLCIFRLLAMCGPFNPSLHS